MSEAVSPRPEPATADPGVFGPDSATWRVHADPSMAIGGLRALMLQTLHPLAMAGIAQHSSYRDDPWRRLLRTAEYVSTVTYGTTAEAEAAGEWVRRVHQGLDGLEPESGRRYRVEDPELLRWVHCAQVDSFLTVYQRCGGRLRPTDADRYVAEQARAASLVGLCPETVPTSVAQLRRYFEGMRPELRATAEARAALWFLFNPPMPLVARPAWLHLAGVAFALLPRWARRRYGWPAALSAVPGVDLAAALSGRSLGLTLRLLPEGVRTSPARRAAIERVADR